MPSFLNRGSAAVPIAKTDNQPSLQQYLLRINTQKSVRLLNIECIIWALLGLVD